MNKNIYNVTGVDTHAHIFESGLKYVNGRRYTPEYNALLDEYFDNLLTHELSHGVLIQPSFLGADNSYMMDMVKSNLDRLRCVAVVERDVSDRTLDQMAESGVVGVRFNLIGKELEDYSQIKWQRFFHKIRSRNWTLEIHRNIEDIEKILPSILKSGIEVVIDHFGRVNHVFNIEQHKNFLALLRDFPIWIKTSATYRTQSSLEQAKINIDILRDAYGSSTRLLWGSDWPHTQFESKTNYDEQYDIMKIIFSDVKEREMVLVNNPVSCYHFNI